MSTEVPYDFVLAEDDRDAALNRTLTDEDGNPENLTSASVTFLMEEPDGTEVIRDSTNAGLTTDGSDGQIYYSWSDTDTATPGSYRARFIIEKASGRQETWPNHRWLEILITES